MLRPLLLAACALLVPAAAGAQAAGSPLDQALNTPPPVAESAADLAYGYCPLFLAGQLSLTGPELARHGFGKTMQTQQNPRFGEISMVTAKRGDSELGFGGASGKTCSVVISGPEREAALARLRSSMSFMGLPFEPTPHNGAQIDGVSVEAFKAPVENQFLHVQLIQARLPVPVVSVQLFATEE